MNAALLEATGIGLILGWHMKLHIDTDYVKESREHVLAPTPVSHDVPSSALRYPVMINMLVDEQYLDRVITQPMRAAVDTALTEMVAELGEWSE